jgi:hypothetical protein
LTQTNLSFSPLKVDNQAIQISKYPVLVASLPKSRDSSSRWNFLDLTAIKKNGKVSIFYY